MVSEHVEVTSYRYIDRLQTNKVWACPDENGSARCRMYTDDGETSDFAAPEHWKTLEA